MPRLASSLPLHRSHGLLLGLACVVVGACSSSADPARDAAADLLPTEGGLSDVSNDAHKPDGARADGLADGLADGGQSSDGMSGAVKLPLASAKDALSSYLMSGLPVGWNIFSGAAVYLGRRSDGAHVSYHTALRFSSVPIPQGAQIEAAWLHFHPTNEVDSTKNLWINIYAEKADDSAAFDPTNYDAGRPDQRAKTSAFIDHWLVRCSTDCTNLTEYDCPQRKLDCWQRDSEVRVPKDLKALVQEIVARPGWKSGNALTLLLINAATDQDGAKYQDGRSITGYDPSRGPQFAPRLEVTIK